MEEYIAKKWADFIEKRSDTGQYSSARIYFEDQKKSLQLFYQLFGGKQNKELKITDKRPIVKKRTLFEKVAGIGKNFVLCWQDDMALYLPESLAYFPKKELNELHYIWLIGMLCNLTDNIDNLEEKNLYSTDKLIRQFPKFKNFYDYAYSHIGVMDNNSVNPLWIYPPLTQRILSTQEEDDADCQKNNDKSKNDTLEQKKQINKSDDNEADGMLIFVPDSPASFMELVNVDRAQDDSFDEDALENAKDLDEISLGKKQANLAARVKMDLNAINDDFEVYIIDGGHYVDEWDYKQGKYLNSYVHINPSYNQDVTPMALPKRLVKSVKKIQNDLDLMHLQRTKITNLSYGDDINLDSWIEYKSLSQKSNHAQRFYENFEKKTRDIATFILADVSLSTETGITQDMRVIDVIKDSLMVFSEALKRLEDRFAIYTFSSLRNKNVYFQMIKHFRHTYGNMTRGRINSVTPGYYTRMGAAIRESLSILEDEKTEKKLLLIVSDGKPNDIDRYDGKYGIEDTKKAIDEAKKQGVVPFCITIDTQAKSYLAYIFGHNNYAVVRDSKKLPQILPELYINLTN